VPDMQAKVTIQVDCLGRPATVEVSSIIRTGIHELDLAQFHAMTLAVRNFADEVTHDQERQVLEGTVDLGESIKEVLNDAPQDIPKGR
jgi:hypothetical protein